MELSENTRTTQPVNWADLKEHCKSKQTACHELQAALAAASGSKTKWDTAVMLAGVFLACVGAFFYISTNAVRDYDLTARERFVLATAHRDDIAIIRRQVEDMIRVQVDMGTKLDRNYAVIEKLVKE